MEGLGASFIKALCTHYLFYMKRKMNLQKFFYTSIEFFMCLLHVSHEKITKKCAITVRLLHNANKQNLFKNEELTYL
jgi:hypothetical protein